MAKRQPEEIDGVFSNKPFKQPKQHKHNKCHRVNCKTDDGEYLNVEFCIKDGKSVDCHDL